MPADAVPMDAMLVGAVLVGAVLVYAVLAGTVLAGEGDGLAVGIDGGCGAPPACSRPR